MKKSKADTCSGISASIAEELDDHARYEGSPLIAIMMRASAFTDDGDWAIKELPKLSPAIKKSISIAIKRRKELVQAYELEAVSKAMEEGYVVCA